jgi:hypothetical protein
LLQGSSAFRQKTVDEFQIQALGIGTNYELAAMVFFHRRDTPDDAHAAILTELSAPSGIQAKG